jgi:hypothetical protein
MWMTASASAARKGRTVAMVLDYGFLLVKPPRHDDQKGLLGFWVEESLGSGKGRRSLALGRVTLSPRLLSSR